MELAFPPFLPPFLSFLGVSAVSESPCVILCVRHTLPPDPLAQLTGLEKGLGFASGGRPEGLRRSWGSTPPLQDRPPHQSARADAEVHTGFSQEGF